MAAVRPNERRRPPPSAGVSARDLWCPEGPWTTVAEFLHGRFPAIGIDEWRSRLADGRVLDAAGARLPPDAAYRSGTRLWYYRSLPAERPIAAQATVLHRDGFLVVADKPHGLPVLPSGGYLQETLLLRLRRALDLPDLAPLHRIDRDTAGLVLLSPDAATRAAYQALFAQRRVDKRYLALTEAAPPLPEPRVRHSRIVASERFPRMCEVPGPANAETWIEDVLAEGCGWRLTLRPVTGRKHQLRVQLAALGMAIRGDVLYGTNTVDEPLQLLAQSIAFVDPHSGRPRRFESRYSLPSSRLSDPAVGQQALDQTSVARAEQSQVHQRRP